MINTHNTFDSNRGDASKILPYQLMSSDADSSQPSSMDNLPNAVRLPISTTEPVQMNLTSGLATSEKCIPNTKDRKPFDLMLQVKERVNVQTNSKLQNNQWNHNSFHSLTAGKEIVSPSINNNNYSVNQNISAFQQYRFNDEEPKAGSTNFGKSNTVHVSNSILDQPCDETQDSDFVTRPSPICRTEDQENAFRRIEDVHNYSKLNRYNYSNDSSVSSAQEDDMEEEDKDEDGDDIEVEALNSRFDIYGHLGSEQRTAWSSQINAYNSSFCDKTAQAVHVDEAPAVPAIPDHHARRPMNAFLIFCKRHRAIVKDRYKSFENRAITKILGDWWASLDQNEKQCYTSLAQQNKDAFFLANPDFKWYKLPAPPLRTLHTRPSNTESVVNHIPDAAPRYDASLGSDHIFKLADEAQMGDLNNLMGDKKVSSPHVFQRTLGETTQYLSIQIPESKLYNCKFETGCKRKFEDGNKALNKSSEEDLVPKKSPRMCKGKIYQELVNSGQISAVTKKKSKIGSIQLDVKQNAFANDIAVRTSSDPFPYTGRQEWIPDGTVGVGSIEVSEKSENSVYSESILSHNTLHKHFDLDKKIKELPALCLDAYLQRKRSTKKKKKASSKRNPSSSKRNQCSKAEYQASTVALPPVGSQKRKARKESITRRDISAIESEVASLIPLREDLSAISCNGSYFYNDFSPSRSESALAPDAFSTRTPNTVVDNSRPTLAANEFFSVNNTSSTSDLLILAEVAAKRTEILN